MRFLRATRLKKERDSRETAQPDDAPLTESERAELERLRAENKDVKSENAQLQMQVNFAKKVATWFAKDQQ